MEQHEHSQPGDHEKHLMQGFNHGYLIAKHEPELFRAIQSGTESKNEYLQALSSGGKEYEHEKRESNKDRQLYQDKERNIEKDK